ncbi:hypothetical protein [Fusobacterium sp. PH5-44]|uniref:hypothetical protein n=1 Tax=unclassified Fusobacterium TaxID=2648384 RepID=UPI003D261AE1
MKKDIKLLILTFIIGTILSLALISKYLSNNKGIDIHLTIKNDRDFKLQIYNEKGLKKTESKDIKKSNNFQKINMELDARELKNLKLNFGIRPGTIYIKEISVVGKKKVVIPFEIIEKSKRENIDIFKREKEYVYITSLKNNPIIVLDDEIIKNKRYTRRNYMQLFALYLVIYFLVLVVVTKISDLIIHKKKK